MNGYIKTTISREKLYRRDYERDYIEVIKNGEEKIGIDKYKALIDILTLKYLEK